MKTKFGALAILSIFALTIIISSCGKETGEDFLVAKTWTFDKLETDATDSLSLFVLELTQFAFTGATMNFKDDGTYTGTFFTESISGTWNLTDDEKELTIANDTLSNVYDVINITETEVSYSENFSEGGMSYKLDYYWK